MRERESTRGIYVEDDPLYNTIRTPHPTTTLTDAISSFSMSTIPNIRAGVLICFQYNIFHSEFLCLVLNERTTTTTTTTKQQQYTESKFPSDPSTTMNDCPRYRTIYTSPLPLMLKNSRRRLLLLSSVVGWRIAFYCIFA